MEFHDVLNIVEQTLARQTYTLDAKRMPCAWGDMVYFGIRGWQKFTAESCPDNMMQRFVETLSDILVYPDEDHDLYVDACEEYAYIIHAQLKKNAK